MIETPDCPECDAADVVKNGKGGGKQRFKCKNCGFQLTSLSPGAYPAETKAGVTGLYNHGLSIRAAVKLEGVSRFSAVNWIKALAKKILEKPAPGIAIHVELDEMWHYPGSRENKLWIWKSMAPGNR